MRISVAADERTGVADAVAEELRRRGHEPLLHGALADGERDDWAWASEAAARDVAEGRADQAVVCCWTGTGASIAANKVRPGGAVRGRGDRPRGAPLERRQRARPVAAHDQPGAARGDPRRLVRGRSERGRRRPRQRAPPGRDLGRQRLALGVAHPGMNRNRKVSAPRAPATARVSRAPSSSATGPVIAKDSGVSPIERTSRSSTPSRAALAGTSVFISVFHTTSAAVPRREVEERDQAHHPGGVGERERDEEHVAHAPRPT